MNELATALLLLSVFGILVFSRLMALYAQALRQQ
jgi:hypothetical protein